MNEKQLDQLLEMDQEEHINQKDLKKMNFTLSKRIYSRVLVIVLIFALLIGGGTWGYRYYLDQATYNPFAQSDIINPDLNLEASYGFSTLMEVYLNMVESDFVTMGCEVTKSGPGDYQGEVYYFDLIDARHHDFLTTLSMPYTQKKIETFRIQKEGFTDYVAMATDHQYFQEFIDVTQDAHLAHLWQIDEAQALYEAVEALPDSSVLDISLSFEQRQSFDDICDFINHTYPDACFSWLALDTYSFSNLAKGMSISSYLFKTEWNVLSLEAFREYPELFLNCEDFLTGDLLRTHYLSNLKILCDHPDFLAQFDVLYPVEGMVKDELAPSNDIPHRYEAALANDPTVFGIRGLVNKEDALKMILSTDTAYLVVNNVKISDLAH